MATTTKTRPLTLEQAKEIVRLSGDRAQTGFDRGFSFATGDYDRFRAANDAADRAIDAIVDYVFGLAGVGD